MFFRKAQSQRDGHARCNLLLTHTLLSNSADWSPVGMRALTGTIHLSLCARVIAHNRQRQELHSCSDRYPFDATQSIFPGTGPVMRLCHRLQLAPSLCSEKGRSAGRILHRSIARMSSRMNGRCMAPDR